MSILFCLAYMRVLPPTSWLRPALEQMARLVPELLVSPDPTLRNRLDDLEWAVPELDCGSGGHALSGPFLEFVALHRSAVAHAMGCGAGRAADGAGLAGNGEPPGAAPALRTRRAPVGGAGGGVAAGTAGLHLRGGAMRAPGGGRRL